MRKPTEHTIRKHFAAVRQALDCKKDYTTKGPEAFTSGELYGMLNALHWVLGDDVASPMRVIEDIKEPTT